MPSHSESMQFLTLFRPFARIPFSLANFENISPDFSDVNQVNMLHDLESSNNWCSDGTDWNERLYGDQISFRFAFLRPSPSSRCWLESPGLDCLLHNLSTVSIRRHIGREYCHYTLSRTPRHNTNRSITNITHLTS